MNNIELTTMCAIIKNNMVLMINRKKTWKGWAFPGGHLENGESIKECIIREIFEETGIKIYNLKYKGITHFYNPQNNKRHIISNFTCVDYDGELQDVCDEGELKWIEISSVEDYNLAEGMKYRLPIFFSDKITELYVEWDENNGYTKVKYNEL